MKPITEFLVNNHVTQNKEKVIKLFPHEEQYINDFDTSENYYEDSDRIFTRAILYIERHLNIKHNQEVNTKEILIPVFMQNYPFSNKYEDIIYKDYVIDMMTVKDFLNETLTNDVFNFVLFCTEIEITEYDE